MTDRTHLRAIELPFRPGYVAASTLAYNQPIRSTSPTRDSIWLASKNRLPNAVSRSRRARTWLRNHTDYGPDSLNRSQDQTGGNSSDNEAERDGSGDDDDLISFSSSMEAQPASISYIEDIDLSTSSSERGGEATYIKQTCGLDVNLLAGIGHMHRDYIHEALGVDTFSTFDNSDNSTSNIDLDPSVRGGGIDLCPGINRSLQQLFGRDHDHEVHRTRKLEYIACTNPPDSLPPLTNDVSTLSSELAVHEGLQSDLDTPASIPGRPLGGTVQASDTWVEKSLTKNPAGGEVLRQKRKQQIRKILHAFVTLQAGCEINQQTSDAQVTQTSPQDVPTTRPRHKPKRKQRAKRRRSGEDSDDDDSSNGDLNPKRPKNETIQKLLACPYYKRHPLKHLKCLFTKLSSTSYVRQHLYRCHSCPSFYCPTCGKDFSSQTLRDQHIRARTCQKIFSGFEGVLSADQQSQLELKTKDGKRPSEIERWNTMWKICFPDEDEFPMSPYLDENIGVELANALIKPFSQAASWQERGSEDALRQGLVQEQAHYDGVRNLILQQFSAFIGGSDSPEDPQKNNNEIPHPVEERSTATDGSHSAQDLIEGRPTPPSISLNSVAITTENSLLDSNSTEDTRDELLDMLEAAIGEISHFDDAILNAVHRPLEDEDNLGDPPYISSFLIEPDYGAAS